MQLKFKKICLLSTIVIYCASFLLQSNLGLLQTRAKEKNIPRVNIVAILVDDKIYGGISNGLNWYASKYIQGKLADTKALVMPINLDNIKAYDIYRMMENIYFDGLENTNSSLIGLIMFGNIPLPVVNQDGYIFPTVYPYVDFENQKYVWDEESQYFVPNGNSQGQAEIWHGLINYGSNIGAYSDFFEKIKKYVGGPDNFIGDSIWYEDFIAQKEAFLDDNYQYYRNKIMFGEDLGYQRYSTLMKSMFGGESSSNSLSIISDLGDAMGSKIEGLDEAYGLLSGGSNESHTTKMVQQEIETSYLADYNELFSKSILSTIRENIFAGGRWIKLYHSANGKASNIVDADSSTSMIQLKDTLYLGNENLQGIIENLNLLMEDMVDKKISDKKFDMDIVIPVSYEKTVGKRLFAGFFQGRKCFHFVEHYDNYYFGNSARYIDSASDLSIFRGTYRNLDSLEGVTYNSLLNGNNSIKSKYDPVDLKLKSIGSSYGIFSNQVEGNRGYLMTAMERDLDIYDEEKSAKDEDTNRSGFLGRVRDKAWPDYCSNDDEDHLCENLFDFAKRWRGGASPINLDENSISSGRYLLKDYKPTDSWRSIFDMGGFQSLSQGADEGISGKGWTNGNLVGPQTAGTNFKSYIKYASPTQMQGWKRDGWYYDRYTNHTPDVHIDFDSMNFWNLNKGVLGRRVKKESSNIFTLYKDNGSSCGWFSSKTLNTKYTYKVISSIVKHVSTTEDEINGIDRDRYGEGGTLWGYYMDLKNAYDDIENNTLGALKELKSLESSISGTNVTINAYNESLNGLGNDLSSINKMLSLKAELSDLYQQLQSLDENSSEYGDVNNQIKIKENEIENLKNSDPSSNGDRENTIKQIIDGLSGLNYEINKEKEQITDIYNLITSLNADKIFSVLERIAAVEGYNPEDFYSGKSNKTKIGFLSQWIFDLKLSENNIKTGANNIIDAYSGTFNLIDMQKNSWLSLAEILSGFNDSRIDEKASEISGVLDEIFIISEKSNSEQTSDLSDSEEDLEDSDEDSQKSMEAGDDGIITLSGSVAEDLIKGTGGIFDTFDRGTGVNAMFDWLIGVDTVGPAIEKAAKSDSDFIAWLKENSIKYGSFTQVDWINQYAQWTKGPGYDSEGAKKNHDLLMGASEHMSGMNILTPDRPIDSPRYVSMQSVAGNEMKFIYPDLYKVEVYVLSGQNKSGYDIHKLLTGGQIKKNLVKYLTGKVYEYNKILEEECKSALKNNEYFNFLRGQGFIGATPDIGVHGCGAGFTYEDFVKALGGEKMLDSISDILYYQSLTNKKKISSGSVEEDIKLIKDSFSLNDKREEVLKDYLTEGNEKTKSQLFVIPTYELSGYEVAYVNSNGKDYIIPDSDEDLEYTDGFNDSVTATQLNNIRSRDGNKTSKQESEMNDECNIPPSGKLPLFKLSGTSVSSPWFEGFKCWLKKTKEEPIKVKLIFDNSLGEILSADSLDDYVKDPKLSENLTQWGDAGSKSADNWDVVIDADSDFDSDKIITEMQVKADKHNSEIIKGDDSVSVMLSNALRNIKITTSNVLLSDSNSSSELGISSLTDVGNVTVTFMGTGDGCLKLDKDVLCNGSTISKTFNPKINPFVGSVVTDDHIAGKVGLDIKINIGGKYIEKVIKYTVSPSNLETADIIFSDNKVVAGMIIPVKVVGYDKYGNRVSRGLEKYKFTVSQGRFLKDGAYQDSFSTNDFRDIRFYYQAPLDAKDGSEAVIQVSKVKDSDSYLATKGILVAKAAPEIKLNGNVVLKGENDLTTNQSYKLNTDESVYTSNKLNVSKLQRLDIEMKDTSGKLIDLDSQIVVTSQNGLVYIGQIQKQENGDDVFFETSKNYMIDGHATVYYYPTTVAGKDLIKIDIPGLDTRVINLSIRPATLESIQIVTEKDVLYLGDTMDIELFLLDHRGNLIDYDKLLGVSYDEDKIRFVPDNGKDGLLLTTVENGYGKYTVEGLGAGRTFISAGGKIIYFNVDKHLFPNSGLNVMYLNYFGNDRGNQWGYMSDNNKYVENLMMKSNKVITTTTQLVSEDKIKRMIWKMQPGFKIWNPDNVNTIMEMGGKKLNLIIGGISSMQSNLPKFTWMSVTQDGMDSILSNDIGASKNYVFFIPSDIKYSVDSNGVLYDDGVRVGSVLNGEVSLQLTNSVIDNGDNVWELSNKGISYGSLILHYPIFSPILADFTTPGKGYLLNPTFSNGSTDSLSSVGLFDSSSDFELQTSYKSIQDSDKIDERIGFLGDFKNITLFAEGEIVGEATKKFGSEFVINLGDPVLSRKDSNTLVYDTDFDGGIGNEIYVDSEKTIFGTYQIDFNNDGQKDLLVVYRDGSIKLSKNYGGTPDLRDMQELMRIAVDIQDVYVGDVDGNKYEDIIIRTSNNQLRAYLNNGGIFDVDGSVGCFNQNVFEGEKSSTPSSLDGIFQMFVEDMDLDGIVDVVTYDNKGYIKVFYGGTTNGGPNYLSKEKYACDPGWYDRQNGNVSIVTALGVQISNEDIFDNSMLHWVGMSRPTIDIKEDELPKYGVEFNPNTLLPLIESRDRDGDGSIELVTKEIMNNFDVKQASQQYVDEGAKYVDVTLYENQLMGGGDGNNYIFAPSSYLNPDCAEDLGSVWKNYRVSSGGAILQDGDIVTVRVTVKASSAGSFQGAYGDIIQGPWNLYFDEDNVFKGIRFIRNPSDAVVKKRDGNFAYIIDNIKLAPSDKLIFEYDLEYKASPLKSVSLTYDTFYSHDNYPDIKGQSIDGCDKNFDVYINNGGSRSFGRDVVDLQGKIDSEYLSEEEMTEDYAEDVIGIGSDVNQLPGIVGDKISRISLLGDKVIEISNYEGGKLDLRNYINEAGISLDLDLNLFEEQFDEIENVIDDITKGMCNGFSFGGSSNCKGLPVPFNQAFLAPGKYHLFGCWQLPMGPLEGGLPVFFFPGTIYVLGAPIPFPWGLKQSASDEFLWPGGGTYPSFIRIYAAPTLTAQLGIAICMSPERIWSKIPHPISDIAGNCVVFAVKPQCNGGGSDDGLGDGDLNNPEETYTDFIEEVRDSGVCMQSQKGPMVTLEGMRSSPFNMYSYSSQVKIQSEDGSWSNFNWVDGIRNNITWNNMDVNGGSHSDVEYSTSLLGIINLETSSYVGPDDTPDNSQNSIIIGGVDVLGGDFTVNKIKGGIQQGVRKILIDKWLDPQIRYIINQLTKMHVNIKLPNVSNLLDKEMSVLNEIPSKFAQNRNKSYKSDDLSRTGNVGGSGSKWEWISSNSVQKINDNFGNPFEGLASLMDESNIINISTETITVKVPMIFAEDINAYEFYLQQWLDTNQKIVDRWDSLLSTFVTSCSKEPDPQKQKECKKEAEENLKSFIEFKEGDWNKMQNQIYTNLMILQEYRNFPFEIYERIHVIDRYMSEIASLINNTIGYLSYWTTTNSQRFVGYVDAITLIINIIKTYQLLIDFSVEWGQNCGNCAKDTYDQYSCLLSMLCDSIQLPILQIPNFKLPNITIDLTNIDLGLDIILPSFNFQPVKINLPELPNLPEPPTFSISIKLFDLPNIPLLPEPPELPELPSFIPEVELQLPILPPAPEVPRLPNTIEGIIKVAKLIGKIYCIVKGGFGLVGEMSVKAKIEQLTQRTYEVDWIDNIMNFTNLSAAPIHNYGVDYEIDSYVDIQFNFTDFYDYLDTLTKSINNLTTSAVNWVNEQTDSIVSDNPLMDIRDSVDGMSLDVDMKLIGDGGVISKADIKKYVDGLTSEDIDYVDYEVGKNRLKNVLSYFKHEIDNTSFKDSIGSSIGKIENQINRESKITVNEQGIEDVRKTVIDYLDNQKVNYDNLAEMINSDYEGFLAMVDSNTEKTVSDDNKKLTFNVKLYNLDSVTVDSINNITKDNPYQSLLDNKQEIIDGYRKAINTNTASDLGLTKSQYLVLRDNISSAKNQINILYNLMKPASSTKLIAKNGGNELGKTLLAGGVRLGSQPEVASVIDPSVLSKGIYEKNSKGKFTKVVYSDLFAEEMGKTYYHTNHTKNHDIVLWDEKSIYKKCNGQNCIYYGGNYGRYYHSSVVDSIPYEETWIKFDSDTKLKIADENEEVKNRKVLGQSYDSLSFTWDLGDADAYLIKLVERIDSSYEKSDYNLKVPVHYVLAIPDSVSIDEISDNKVKLELLNSKSKEIYDILGKELFQIVYYDANSSNVNVSISDIDRKWYYPRIATLNLVDDTYMITSPWSNQVVAGRQIVGDDLSPNGEAVLYRPSISEIVSEGDDLEGYVGTKYKLIVNWDDNVALSYINLSKDGVILDEKYTSEEKDSVSTNIDIHSKSGKESFVSVGIDQFGNKNEKLITVSYEIPGIEITNIHKNPDGETVSIQAELTQDIDQGNVSFQRRRGEVWKTMKRKGMEVADLSIGVGDNLIVGTPYSAGNEIAMYDKNDEVIALMDPDTAEIKFQTGYKEDFEVRAIVQNGVTLKVYNKSDQKSIFTISIPAKECVKFEADNYSIVDLPEIGRMGMFNGGRAIYKDGTNVLFSSPTCHLYSELGLEGTYDYDREMDAVVLNLYQLSDLSKSNPIKVWFKVKPFMES